MKNEDDENDFNPINSFEYNNISYGSNKELKNYVVIQEEVESDMKLYQGVYKTNNSKINYKINTNDYI